MVATIPEGVQLVTPGDLGDELASFIRAMRSNNVSPNTITAYGGAVRQFGLWLMEQGYRTDVRAIERRHIEEWINSILEHRKPATAHNRFRGLQRFMNWYKTKDDDFTSPMRKLRSPRLPKLMPRVLSCCGATPAPRPTREPSRPAGSSAWETSYELGTAMHRGRRTRARLRRRPRRCRWRRGHRG